MALTFAKIGSQFFKMLNNPSKIVKDFQNFANTGHPDAHVPPSPSAEDLHAVVSYSTWPIIKSIPHVPTFIKSD